jgi:hypothetical protein
MGHFLPTFFAVTLGVVVGGVLLVALLWGFGYFIVPWLGSTAFDATFASRFAGSA